MVSQRIILVSGATGRQGGTVVEYLLEREGFGVRALTRNPGGEVARALAGRGVDVVKGDLEDPASLEEFGDVLLFLFGGLGNPEASRGDPPRVTRSGGRKAVEVGRRARRDGPARRERQAGREIGSLVAPGSGQRAGKGEVGGALRVARFDVPRGT